jgi:1-acyl-sn-glycerol-3-phosphate acyltransferase
MAEPVYRTLAILVKSARVVTGTRITYLGMENIPERGAAVVAINHTGYVDWFPACLAIWNRGRRLRVMIKAEMNEVPIVRWLIKKTKMVPVDRTAGSSAYTIAVERLRDGELVGVYPEATISRSFELKEFKTGAARMAIEADVPIVPMIVWGAHRAWTKDHPKKLGRNKFPITVVAGAPIKAAETVEATNQLLRVSMTELLHRAQEDYQHPQGEFWVPRRLGGGAPTLAEAKVLDEIELGERARKRAEREAKS